MPRQLAITLSDEEEEWLARKVTDGVFRSREAALHAALEQVRSARSEEEIAEAYRRAYERTPEDDVLGRVGLRLASERMRTLET